MPPNDLRECGFVLSRMKSAKEFRVREVADLERGRKMEESDGTTHTRSRWNFGQC